MKLAVISARYPYAPTEAYLGVELALLAERGDVVVAPVTGGGRLVHRSPVDVIDVPPYSLRTFADAAASLVFAGPRAVAAVAAMIGRPNSPRIAMKNAAVIPKALALARRLRAARIDHVHGYWMSTAATVAYIVARVNCIPFSATAHRWDIYEANALAPKLSTAAFVRAISERGAADLRRASPDGERVRVMRVGVRVPPASAPRRATAGSLVLLCAAELLPVKGHGVLLDALARARAAGVDVRCDLAGTGSERDAIAREVAQRGLTDRVTLLGNVAHGELMQALGEGRYDAAILTSLERGTLMEGVPVALMEAMAAGLPCIATASGSIGELIDPTCGILCNVGDAAAIAAAMARLARDPQERASLGDAARARIIERFEVEATTARFAAALENSAGDDRR